MKMAVGNRGILLFTIVCLLGFIQLQPSLAFRLTTAATRSTKLSQQYSTRTTTKTTAASDRLGTARKRRSHRIYLQAASSSAAGGSNRPLQRPPLFTQVISDVDDTIKSSGGVTVAGVALGGIDVQYKRGEIYPGVTEFYFQLSIGSSSIGTSSSSSNSNFNDDTSANLRTTTPPAKVAILTARAEEFKAALQFKEGHPVAVAFRETGQAHGISNWGLGPTLFGSVAEWIAQDRKGLRKFSNFERLLEQDPTGRIFQYIYVGDTGELDQEAGETMLREYPQLVKAVFLHVVSDIPGPIEKVPPPKFINGRPIIFFRTYVGAAVAAVQLDFISVQGLQRIMQAATQKLINVSQTSSKWQDLNRDLAKANKILQQY